MKKLFLMMSVLLSAGLFCACSNDGDEIVLDENGNVITNYNSDAIPSFEPSDVNKMSIKCKREPHDFTITSDFEGSIDSCWLYRPYCGTVGSVSLSDGRGGSYNIYPMVFTAVVRNSSLFTILQFDLNNKSPKKIEELEVGDTFRGVSGFGPDNIRIEVQGGIMYEEEPKAVNGYIPWDSSKGGALGGKIQVVDKKTDTDGKTYITLSLQDIKFYDYDKELNQVSYALNGLIEFEICEDGLHPKEEPKGPTMKELLTPSPDLLFFMMEELHGYESQGQCPFFSKDTGAQECLIINSEEEFREAYKSEKELPKTGIDFKYCTLVIGRTYGENGGVTLGDYELVDNGDSYQINVTLNNNVNPDYTYTPAVKDLYFWRIYPKMENKPVVFNRIRKDVNIDPLDKESAYSQICGRWILELYADEYSGFTNLPVNNSKRYSIEVTDNGWIKGYIDDTNVFSCNYMITYTAKQYYNGYNLIDHGIIKLWDWEGTNVNNDDPISKMFMQISNVTQFRLITTASRLTLDISASEWLFFHREN